MMEKIETENQTFYILGTAHVSHKSVEEVEQAIAEIKPDAVCVELCQTRYNHLMNQNRWQDMDIVQIIKQKKTGFLLASLLLSAFQKKIGKELNIKPGAEMVSAIEKAKEAEIPFHLVDREVNITIRRTWNKLGLWEKSKLMSQLFLSTLFQPKIKEEELENLKSEDILNSMIAEISKHFPKVKEVLLDERDIYLAQKIAAVKDKVVLAVIGAGHTSGVVQHLKKNELQEDLRKFEQIPSSKKIFGPFLKWGIVLVIVGILTYGFWQADAEVSFQLILRWVLVNGVLSALGAFLAKGHILSICVAFVAAPFTSLNPTISAGWASGLMEAYLRKPRVKDFESLSEDVLNWKGLRKNLMSRILLVVVFTNIGSTLGTFLAIPLLTGVIF